MREIAFPLVATSGNLSEEPICTDEHEALHRLRDVADVFLVHNRPIVRHVDDSIARVMLGRELVLRRARGYAPLPVAVRKPVPGILAVGGHLKNTVALSLERNVFISQHIGDLENDEALEAFHRVIESLCGLYKSEPARLASDLQPDYLATKYARELGESGMRLVPVQHHHAHIASCMADNGLESPVIGVAFDGTGMGADGNIWGGEFLIADYRGYRRVGHLEYLPLPGGAAAIKRPYRTAITVAKVLNDMKNDGSYDKLFDKGGVAKIFGWDKWTGAFKIH